MTELIELTRVDASPRVTRADRLLAVRRRLATVRLDAVVGAGIVGFFALCAIAPGLIASADPLASPVNGLTDTGEPKAPGQDGFWLGTDVIGRDHWSRIVHGARVAMILATVPNLLALAIAVVIGLTAGYCRGWVEIVLMRITETLLVLPVFLIAMAVIATFGASVTTLVLTLALVSWSYPARIVHAEVTRLRSSLHVEAAVTLGAGGWRVATRHILPHLRPLLMVYFTMNAAFMVLLEAGLGFLGFGVQPPTPSWGAMLADSRDQFFHPWLIIVPGVCLALLGAGFYLVGQGFRRSNDSDRVAL